MELIKQGAEAKLFRTQYLGRDAVVKQRQHKKYREKSLDERILKERIRTECNLLSKAKEAGIRTPVIWKIDLKEMEIVSEFISGKTLKEELLGNLAKEKKEKLCEDAGELIGKMHSKELIHGDLTTSNIILHNKVLVFLDFGLGTISSKIEDKAVDLLVFKKTFLATHYKILDLWKKVEEAYCKGNPDEEKVLKQLLEVEARARYF